MCICVYCFFVSPTKNLGSTTQDVFFFQTRVYMYNSKQVS